MRIVFPARDELYLDLWCVRGRRIFTLWGEKLSSLPEETFGGRFCPVTSGTRLKLPNFISRPIVRFSMLHTETFSACNMKSWIKSLETRLKTCIPTLRELINSIHVYMSIHLDMVTPCICTRGKVIVCCCPAIRNYQISRFTHLNEWPVLLRCHTSTIKEWRTIVCNR